MGTTQCLKNRVQVVTLKIRKMEYNPDFNLPQKKWPIVIVGAGGIVKDAHLQAYQMAGFEVVAIYDPVQEKARSLQKSFGITHVCQGLPELIDLARQSGCVFDLAVPASEILPILQELPDNAALLIQKPLGENLTQALEIIEACKAKKITAGVNFQLRHAPYIKAAKAIIDEGEIGELHDLDVRMNVYTPWHLWEFLYTVPRLEILYHSIHYLDMIRYFLGEPVDIYAKSTRHPNSPELSSIRSSIIMDYGDLKRANINTNHGHHFGSQHQESYLKFEGTDGAIKITMGVYLDYPTGKPDQFEYISLKEGQQWKPVTIRGSWYPDAFIGPMAGLMHKIDNPEYEYINSIDDALKTMELVEKCYQTSGY